tara:strand:- start:1032 stop:1193 length:162 start_codon:yes stop_codon:yes gene_type:complete
MGSLMGCYYWCPVGIFEVYVEGTEETYGTKKKWAYNTGADLLVEIGAAWWMVA